MDQVDGRSKSKEFSLKNSNLKITTKTLLNLKGMVKNLQDC